MSAHAIFSAAPAQSAAIRIDARRKFLPLHFFCVVHGVDVDVALELVENHRIWPAFNLSSRSEGKRKVHVWRGAVESFTPGQSTARGKLAEVIDASLPMVGLTVLSSATVRAVELAFRFCLASETISLLLRAGELREVGSHDAACQSPRVSRASVVSFLERRLL